METHAAPERALNDLTDILDLFNSVRQRTLDLAAPLSAEDQVVQSMPDVSPTKWHLAHTSWFFETFVLRDFDPDYQPFDPDFHYLFNSYYEAEGPRHARPRRGLLTRPSLKRVMAYRAHVDEAVRNFMKASQPERIHEFRARMTLGCHHEEQHQELILMDIKHVLAQNPLKPAYAPAPSVEAATPAPPIEWIAFEEGLYEIGHAGPAFAFDNEGPRHKTYLYPFALASRPVTNADYLAFMAAGGYKSPEFWLSDGWATVQEQEWDAPLYWRAEEDSWRVFTLGGERAVDPDAPVCHLSYYEADAYARWAGARLPTEQEWEVAAADEPVSGHFMDVGLYQPSARWAAGQRFQKLFGDVWEWTASAYNAYPGFKPAEGAIGEYNGKFMCNQFVLRGGAAVTPARHVRTTYRNFFPPHSRWMFSGLRLAKDL